MKRRIRCGKRTSVIAGIHHYTNDVQQWECQDDRDTNIEMTAGWFRFNDALDEKSKSQHKQLESIVHCV